MIDYYERRAPHDDDVYERPERRPDLHRLATLIPAALAGRRVLELAAGTGHWTAPIAAAAASVHATGADAAPLAIAEARDYPHGSTHEVLTSLPTQAALRAVAAPYAARVSVTGLTGFWLLTSRTRG